MTSAAVINYDYMPNQLDLFNCIAIKETLQMGGKGKAKKEP